MVNVFEKIAIATYQTAHNVMHLCSRLQGYISNKIKYNMHAQGEVAAEVQKAAAGGERQAAPSLKGIRADHRGRYAFAKQFIMKGARVLDMACGVGYGAYIIAHQTPSGSIVAIDNSADAIAYASKYYSSPKIDYQRGDCLSILLEPENFDVILCFETIEHVVDEIQLLRRFYQTLKPQGRLLCSTPNQKKMPYNRVTHPFHLRHYNPEEFRSLLQVSGFHVEQLWSQKSHFSSEVSKGWDGLCNIAVCKKK